MAEDRRILRARVDDLPRLLAQMKRLGARAGLDEDGPAQHEGPQLELGGCGLAAALRVGS